MRFPLWGVLRIDTIVSVLLVLYVRNHEKWQGVWLMTLTFNRGMINWLNWRRNEIFYLALLLLNWYLARWRLTTWAWFSALVSRPLSHFSMMSLIITFDFQRWWLTHLRTGSMQASGIILLRWNVFLSRMRTTLVVSVWWLFRLPIFIVSLTRRLHFLDEISKELLELVIFLVNFDNRAFNHFNTLSISTYLILNL